MTQWKDHIASDPNILFGKLVVKGTRIPVELILEKLAVGNSLFEEILKAYPKLTYQDILACQAFDAQTKSH